MGGTTLEVVEFAWIDPLELTVVIEKKFQQVSLFFSGAKYSYSGNYSFLGFGKNRKIENIEELQKELSFDQEFHENFWMGYFPYEIGEFFFEKKEKICFRKFDNLIIFDHQKKKLKFYSKEFDSKYLEDLIALVGKKEVASVKVSNLASNMSSEEYLHKIETIKEAIKAGDFYQANLTRKFYGNFVVENKFSLFCQLCEESPAPYSAFLKDEEKYIISSSPERFIQINQDGKINTRPIKGSAARFSDKELDKKSYQKLKNSEKDQAENLMIVDLMRNDLARSSKAGSVKVDKLFAVDSYKTIHHMSSDITAQKNGGLQVIDVIKNSFPPGSMTGTPKTAAIKICKTLEKKQRGVYSGILGYFSGNGEVDFSVVIRTLIISNNKFEFQVGGAIIYDSVAELELQETMIKASAIAKILGFDIDDLKCL